MLVIAAALAARPRAGSSTSARRERGQALVAQLLALAQTLLVAQVGLGLLLLSDDRRAPDELHYVYGSLALGRGPRPVALRAGRTAPPAALVRGRYPSGRRACVRAFMTA